MSSFVITDKDEFIFKSLMIQAKSLLDKANFLESNGIVIEDLTIAWGEIENCLLTIFEVPEDNTDTTMILQQDGSFETLPNCFCRDGVDDILWSYTSGEISLDACLKKFKGYLKMVRIYRKEFPLG